MDDLIALDTMEAANEALDYDVSDQKAVYACLRILMKGFLTEMIEEIKETLPQTLDARDRH